jgi:hypothetical protein
MSDIPDMDYYDLTAECMSCGNTYNEGCPVVVDMGMCPTCTFGEAAANVEAVNDIFFGTAKTTR